MWRLVARVTGLGGLWLGCARAPARSSISGTLSARDAIRTRPTGPLAARVLGNGGSARPRVSNRAMPGKGRCASWGVQSFLSHSLLSSRQSSLGTARPVSLRLVSAEPRALSATHPLGHSLVFPHVRSKTCLYR